MDLKNYIILFSAGINLLLGIFVYFKGRDKLVNRIYGLLAFSVFYWGIGMVLYRFADSVENSVFWCRILYVAPIFIVGLFLYFSYLFPEEKAIAYGKILSFFAITICVAVLYLVLFTDTIIKNVFFNPGQEKTIIFGQLYLLYSIFISAFFIWAYINLLIKRARSTGIARTQITYVFWGTFLASVSGMVTNLTLPTFGNFYLNWLGQILSLIMTIFIAYAIVRHRLLDIKLVMRRSTVYLASVLTIVAPAGVGLYYLDRFFPQYIIFVGLAILILGVSAFAPIRNFFYRQANKYFFSSLYDSRELIANLSDKLRSTLNINQIYDFIAQALTGALRIKAFGVLDYDQNSKEYVAQYNNGFNIGERKRFPGNETLRRAFVEQSKSIVTEEIKESLYPGTKETVKLLNSFGAAVLTPLNIRDETIGLMVLGQKESGDMFNDEDLKTLEVIGSQAAIAIKNAQLYEETKNFSLTLQAEVDRQTDELKKANIELKKLDQAKTDFISIASHQLRTPSSIIKGFVSMMLEGAYGRLSESMRDKLEKVYSSNERLSRLIDDLLDLSHMEGGKMKFDFAKVDLAKLTASVVEELSSPAAKKKLKLEFSRGPGEFFVRADEGKLRQVISNLTDNGIKYTEKGGVAVALTRQDNEILVSIRDTGTGMTKPEIANLFQKFVRGPNAPRLHTEGVGIGLYIAKKMLEEHQAQIWAESDGEGQGSTFFVKLPALKK